MNREQEIKKLYLLKKAYFLGLFISVSVIFIFLGFFIFQKLNIAEKRIFGGSIGGLWVFVIAFSFSFKHIIKKIDWYYDNFKDEVSHIYLTPYFRVVFLDHPKDLKENDIKRIKKYLLHSWAIMILNFVIGTLFIFLVGFRIIHDSMFYSFTFYCYSLFIIFGFIHVSSWIKARDIKKNLESQNEKK